MGSVTISPKYQVVIPKEVRQSLQLHPGEKMEVFCFDGRIEMVRIRPMREMRGFLKGMDPAFIREKTDRV